MANEEDVPLQDGPAQASPPPPPSPSPSSSSGEDEAPQVEWLATGRAKRSTAGNRLHSLLQQEETDDELELLFAEADDDAGFSDHEADSDVQMDSSSDEDDQGPTAGDDLEGEKELEKQARAERLKKRKQDGGRGVPKAFKKRVKIDPTVVSAPPPRPKKKSERASWIPTAEEAPTRASARGTTKQSKEQLHAQMVDREIRRLNQLANMDRAAKRREAAKKPPMTQEDRLKEAARVEKSNSKSLSRWEEAEQQREEEQLAKLAALKNRKVEGPVVTWWSGIGEWVGGKLRKVGKNMTIEDKEKPSKKRKLNEDEDEVVEPVPPESTGGVKEKDVSVSTGAGPSATAPKEPSPVVQRTSPNQFAKPYVPPPEMRFQPPAPSPRYIPGPPNSSVLAPPAGLPLSAPPPPLNGLHRPYIMGPFALDGSAPLPGFGIYAPPPPFTPSTPFTPNRPSPLPPPEVPPPPPTIEHGACNYLILENFNETAIRDKNVQTQILFGRKFIKAPRLRPPPVLCVITGHPARYRDPATGLPYYSAHAYKEIQKLKRGEYKWSALVGAYVGVGGCAARGVPGRFLDAKAPGPVTATATVTTTATATASAGASAGATVAVPEPSVGPSVGGGGATTSDGACVAGDVKTSVGTNPGTTVGASATAIGPANTNVTNANTL
ncbi:uncharacterized protein L3040_006747 [Drepanopeziza brunnea f. sp. 'multigermtubi']|uniref:YL1 nuclear protein n=1 Tax=Marssonina brunnea f. sp. multigermtubi (strain MB_m1) TaxID=1072389 RepID=K1WX40_MARBU|nr:YL1 nuclear protein [Drepanopeziza brunnea f. sp. 'multigermtubi' MB_m1]EKD17626.1 YL1 nuclear protein [Drepanopeziza brunnea f. sp. 'multigermtubi' MB_m1]KAJ5039077.1 hypothetical protein L3040_006747 [Drepanopeziza brunnea f. sp. 'multigermtubi']